MCRSVYLNGKRSWRERESVNRFEFSLIRLIENDPWIISALGVLLWSLLLWWFRYLTCERRPPSSGRIVSGRDVSSWPCWAASWSTLCSWSGSWWPASCTRCRAEGIGNRSSPSSTRNQQKQHDHKNRCIQVMNISMRESLANTQPFHRLYPHTFLNRFSCPVERFRERERERSENLGSCWSKIRYRLVEI